MENLFVSIPEEVANLQLPDPELLEFYKNIDNRMYWIDSEIDNYSLELIKYILTWNGEDKKLCIPIEQRKPIKLFFFSPGGDIDINYALIDTIELSQTPIIGINIGQCASAAAFIFLSCHKRYMLPHSYFLFHQGSGTIAGNFGEICAQMQDYQQQVDELAAFMIKHTNYTKEEIEDNIVNEWYVRKDEALNKRVCDGIIDDISILL